MKPDLTLADMLHELTYHPYRQFSQRINLKQNKRAYAAVMANMLDLRMKLRQAKRFVLDDDFVDASVKAAAQQPPVIARYTQLAHLPFPIVWVEYNGDGRDQAQQELGTMDDLFAEGKGRCGFLLMREHAPTEHPVWSATYVAQTKEDTAWVAPIQYRLRCPMPKEDNYQNFAAYAWGYSTTRSAKGAKYVITPQLEGLCTLRPDPYFMYPYYRLMMDRLKALVAKAIHEGRGDMRWLVTALTMINHVPMQYVHVPVTTARHMVKTKSISMLNYSTLQIVAGAPRTINLSGAPPLPTGIRHKQHDVRGFNRVLHRGTARERTTWVREHKRGDPVLGVVNHDYEVVR